MNKNSFIKANNQVKALVGLKGVSFGRVAAMAWINFGAGNLEYALHLQGCFRLCKSDKILVTNMEMFEPSNSALNKATYNYDTFDWDIQGENRYDEWVKGLNLDFLSALTVIDAKVNLCGDITILFEQNIVIEVFINAIDDECWRLFKIGSDQHLVMTGNGLEDE